MSEWISVKDQVPDDDRFVLIYASNDYYFGFLDEGIWKDDEWMEKDVTHWQELTEPPKSTTQPSLRVLIEHGLDHHQHEVKSPPPNCS